MFAFTKIAELLLEPGRWLLALLIAGTVLLWTRWRGAGRWMLTGTVGFVVLISVLPVGTAMIAVLEDRFPPVRSFAGPIDGIVVLGGSVNQFITRARGQPSLTRGAERLTEFIALARRFPEARLAFTGGSASLLHPDVKETEVAQLFFQQMGLDLGRVSFEGNSRNTYENAVFTRRLIHPKPGERWVLITSAAHMPRSVGAFRKAGWKPIPYPVDYQTSGLPTIGLEFNMASGLVRFATGLREWLALVAYRLMGRTNALLPGPQPDAS